MSGETIARALGGRRTGGTWMARCPAHEDRTPSLAITDAKGGNVLVRCHAGCDQRDVIAALRARSAWETTGRNERRFSRKVRHEASAEPEADSLKRTQAALSIWQASRPAEGTPVASYLRSRGFIVASSIRFHYELKHPLGGVWPAMVALVTRGR